MTGRLFWASAALALLLHGAIVARTPGLRGGADLLPHLRLIEQMREAPALRNTYAPAFHALGALLTPWLGLEGYVGWFSLAAAAALLAGFRAFQRAAGLPDESAALFALSPCLVALSMGPPKVEAAGYALTLVGLACLLRERRVGAALVLAAAFWVHTAAALLLGLAGGVLCLARRDVRGLAALAAGTALASPLVVAHLQAGCTLAQALLFSEGDYLRARALPSRQAFALVPLLAGPLVLALAVQGARLLRERDRSLALVGAVLVAIYLNELWLAPFGRGTTLTLVRGLPVLAIPVAAAGGLALAARPRWRTAAIVASALWLVGTTLVVAPRVWWVRQIGREELVDLEVDRCVFRWKGPHVRSRQQPAPGARADG